jgi:hypothetical protein
VATEVGTFVSATGGTFETVMSGSIKPLPSSTNRCPYGNPKFFCIFAHHFSSKIIVLPTLICK